MAQGTPGMGLSDFPNWYGDHADESEVQIDNEYSLVLSVSHMIFQYNSAPSVLTDTKQPFLVELKFCVCSATSMGQDKDTWWTQISSPGLLKW